MYVWYVWAAPRENSEAVYAPVSVGGGVLLILLPTQQKMGLGICHVGVHQYGRCVFNFYVLRDDWVCSVAPTLPYTFLCGLLSRNDGRGYVLYVQCRQ